MNHATQVAPIGPLQRDPLISMYDSFDPPGASLGLPPHTPEARRAWIAAALAQPVNLAAFSAPAVIVGHCFLAADQPGSAELAVFVHQDARRIGIGRALVKAALDRASAGGLRRVWAIVASDNRAALGLLVSCGFRNTLPASQELELELHLPAPGIRPVQPLNYPRLSALIGGRLLAG